MIYYGSWLKRVYEKSATASTNLRKWFYRDPEQWKQFKQLDRLQLKKQRTHQAFKNELSGSAKNEGHNEALVL